MIIPRKGAAFPHGYTAIAEEGGSHGDMLMDFGIVRLWAGESFETNDGKERALLLMTGNVRFSWSKTSDADAPEQHFECNRANVLEVEPTALHVPAGVKARVECHSGVAELALQARNNAGSFEPRLWKPGDYRSDRFGEGAMQDTSTRIVRTIFDAATAPDSAMVLGEVINQPGKWSSYPPHDHAHPEIYHYRFFPGQGYGHAECEDKIFKVTDGDSYAIPPGVTHSQCAAPGYAMYYIWAIPHLPGDRFGPDSRVFRQEHTWLMDKDSPIWPDAPLSEVLSGRSARPAE